MKVLMINIVCGIRSTGRICTDIAGELERLGHEVKIAYGRGPVPAQYEKYAVRIGSDLDENLHGVEARLWDGSGFGSRSQTRKFLKWVEEFDPDIIHLQNIHGYYLNVELLFAYLKRCGKRIVWTMHDCWGFTGHCTYYDYARCGKWKTGCGDCPQRREYPKSLTDFSGKNWLRKKEAFCGVADFTIVTPSRWLAEETKKSFLREYPIEVIPNGIDIGVFRPVESDIKERYGIAGKHIVLGVAALWDRRKGLEDLVALAGRLGAEWQVVVIGLSEAEKKVLDSRVLGICHTANVEELVQWYSCADVFVNPTLEDNYPTTNLEAIACGTPVITYDTGGSPESAGYYGIVVKRGDVDGIVESIGKIGQLSCAVDDREKLSRGHMVQAYLDVYMGK